MSLRHRHARLLRKPAELMLVPMIDIFTVLVTFLLMTAVFSRIAIVELDLPSTAAGPAVTEPQFRLEVIVRKEGFELTNGTSVIAAIPKQDGAYDLQHAVRTGAVAQAGPSGRRRRLGAARARDRLRRPDPGHGCRAQHGNDGRRRGEALARGVVLEHRGR